jgi:hypothetical protein
LEGANVREISRKFKRVSKKNVDKSGNVLPCQESFFRRNLRVIDAGRYADKIA